MVAVVPGWQQFPFANLGAPQTLNPGVIKPPLGFFCRVLDITGSGNRAAWPLCNQTGKRVAGMASKYRIERDRGTKEFPQQLARGARRGEAEARPHANRRDARGIARPGACLTSAPERVAT
jgi:hypothetical protein